MIVSDPVTDPVVVGAKVTEIVQLVDASTDDAHVLVSAKPLLVTTFVMWRVAFPVFESVMVCAALDDPVGCEPNVKLAVDKEVSGPIPVPVNDAT